MPVQAPCTPESATASVRADSPPVTFGDCRVYGSYADDPEPDRLMTVAIGPHRFCKRWHQYQTRIGRRELLSRMAEAHRVERHKDRFLMFPGELAGARRLAEAVVSLEGIFLDYEGDGITFAAVSEALLDSGLTGLAWTSHSHKAGDERGRIFLPLSEPYVVDRSLPLERRKALWKVRYDSVGNSLGLPFDPTGSTIERAMYTAAHPPGAPFGMVMTVGRCLVLPDIDLPPERERTYLAPRKEGVAVANEELRRAFGRLLIEDCDRFDVCGYLDSIGWECHRWDGPDKVTITCPNQHEHSDPDKIGGTVALSPNEQQDTASITCRHAHCSHIRPSDHLAMIAEAIEIDGDPIEIARGYVTE
jgi:hypothetical protein